MDKQAKGAASIGAVRKYKFSWFDVLNTAILSIWALVTLFPFYYVLIVSFADYKAVQAQPVYIFPTTFSLAAFKMIMNEKMFVNAFTISVFITIVGTAFSLFVSTTAAYTLSKKNIPGSKLLFAIAIIPMYFSGGIIPFFLQVKSLGLFNSFGALIFPAAISTFYLILIKNYFGNMPPSLEESARIDGASDLRIFLQIVLPLSKPIIATVTLFFAVDKWNEYYNAMLFIQDKAKLPLQNVLREVINNFNLMMGSSMGQQIMQNNMETYTQSLQMAIIVMATVPVIIIYPFLQKYFTTGIMLGAVKE